MKKVLTTLTLLFSLLSAAQSQIVITEIMYNPPEGGTDSLEYIEFYNKGAAAVNMEGWTMFGVQYTFPAGTSLAPGAYLILAKSASAMQIVFGKTALQWTSGALSNGGETIRLNNPSGTEDEVAFVSTDPWPTSAAGLGTSIVLCDPNADNSLPASWVGANTPTGAIINNIEVLANPGAGCPTGLFASIDNFTVVPLVSTALSVLTNDNLPKPLTSLTITQAPLHGTATVNADNTVQYVSAAGYCGPDLFKYQICDAPNNCASATVNIKIKCYPQRQIAIVSEDNNFDGVADSLGIHCELRGIVHGINIRPTGLQLVLIDVQGNQKGIALFRNTGNFGYNPKEGDDIIVRGTIGQFQGLSQVNLDTVIKMSSGNGLAFPIQANKPSEFLESSLMSIENLVLINPAQWTSGMGAGGFTALAVNPNSPGDTVAIRIDNDVDLYNEPAPQYPFNLRGLGGQFDQTAPYNDGYQILPRYKADLKLIVATHQADFSANVTLSPNPAQDQLFVRTDLAFSRVQIVSAAGQLLQTMEQPDFSKAVDISRLPTGAYFIRFEQDEAFWTTRFLKQ